MSHLCISFKSKASNTDYPGSRHSRGLETEGLWFHEPPRYTKVCFVRTAADLGLPSTAPEDDKRCVFNRLGERMSWHTAWHPVST